MNFVGTLNWIRAVYHTELSRHVFILISKVKFTIKKSKATNAGLFVSNTTTTNVLNPQNHCNSTSLLAVTMTLRNKYFKQELLGVLLDLQRVCVISYYFITDHKVEVCLRIHKGTTYNNN